MQGEDTQSTSYGDVLENGTGSRAGRSREPVFGVLVAAICLLPSVSILIENERGGELAWLAGAVLPLWAGAGVLTFLVNRVDHALGVVLCLVLAVLAIFAAANPTVNRDGLGALVVFGVPLFADMIGLVSYLFVETIRSKDKN